MNYAITKCVIQMPGDVYYLENNLQLRIFGIVCFEFKESLEPLECHAKHDCHNKKFRAVFANKVDLVPWLFCCEPQISDH